MKMNKKYYESKYCDSYDIRMMRRIFAFGITLASLYTIAMLVLYHLA